MFLGVEMAAFELGVCSGGERFVSDQHLEKALAKVLETYDGVENLSAEQRDGIASLIRRHDVLAVLPTGYGKSLLFQLIPKFCVELHNLGYSYYPKSLIVIVICPLNALIECHMKQVEHRGISCTCLSGDTTKMVLSLVDTLLIFANPEALILNEKWRKMLQTSVSPKKKTLRDCC